MNKFKSEQKLSLLSDKHIQSQKLLSYEHTQ